MGSPSLDGHCPAVLPGRVATQFQETYDELRAWFTNALRQLEDMKPITGDPDAVAAQLSKPQGTVMLKLRCLVLYISLCDH